MKSKGQRAKGLELWTNKSIRLLILLCFLCLYFLSSAQCYILSVGHFSPSVNNRSFLLITDLSGLGPAIEVRFYDDIGRLVSSARKLLPSNGKIQIVVENYLRNVGNIVVESPNEQIMGEYWQICEYGTVFMLPLQSSVEGKRYFVNCFRLQPCSSNLLVISDPYGASPIIQMEFYNKTGELIRVASNMLQPHGMLTFNVNEYAPWDVLGKVSIRSFRGSIVVYYWQLCGNNVVLAVPARLPAKELLINKFSTSGGKKSSLVIADASAEGPATKIQFLSENSVSTLNKLLPPNGILLIELAEYIGSIDNGVIQIGSEAGIIADYWERGPQTILNTPAVNRAGSVLFISHFSPFNNTRNLLSLLNVGQESVKAEIQFYSNEGRKLGSKEFFLETYRQVEELMDSYFDGVSSGTIIVRSSSASLLATSYIIGIRNNRHIGKAHAQVVR